MEYVIDDGEFCPQCGTLGTELECVRCGIAGRVINCGHYTQPRFLAVNGTGGTEPTCEWCEDESE